MNEEYDSALGTHPTCDICGLYIKLGDKVTQIFVGTVVQCHKDELELGIKEESYSLYHVGCEVKMN